MRRFALLLGILFFAASAHAQNYSQWEIFGGGSYLNTNSSTVPLGNGANFVLNEAGYGWHFTLAENKFGWLGGILDFSGDYSNQTVNFGTATSPLNVRFNGSAYPFLFGPRFYLRNSSRIVPFGDALIGGVHIRAKAASATDATSKTTWAYALGGGVDYNVTSMVAIRVQGDWIRAHFPESLTVDSQNLYRASAGIVFKFGGR